MYRTGKQTNKQINPLRGKKKKSLEVEFTQPCISSYQSMCLYLGRSPQDVLILSRELDKQINDDSDTICLISFLHL